MAIVEESSVAAAELRLTNNPGADSGRKVDIGSDTYWFGPNPTPGAIPVTVGVDVAGSRFNLVNAINTSGNANILASTYEDVVRIVAADAPGGSPVAGAGPNLPLAYNAGGMFPTDKWNVNNLMQTENTKFAHGEKTVDSALSQQNTFRVTFAFTPAIHTVECVHNRLVRTLNATIQGQDVVISLAGCRLGSKIRWYVYGN
jgi:hypothetical protein